MNEKTKILLLFSLIVGIAIFFRFYRLDSVPPGLYPDVAINGNDAIKSLQTGSYKLFYPDNNGREGLIMWLDAAAIYIFGASVWALKFPAALFGSLTVIGLYLLARQLFEKNSEFIALLSSFFLAVSFWHVNFSRIGFRAILVPFFLVFAFYFFVKGFRSRKNAWQIPAGLFFAGGFYTYISFRLAVPLLFCALAGWFLHYWRGKLPLKFLRASAILLATIFLAALPIGIYFLFNFGDFIGRAGQTSVFSSPSPLLAFGKSLAAHLAMFNIYGDGNWRHNYAGSPELFWPVGILFLTGLAVSVKRLAAHVKIRDFGLEFNSYLLLLSWLVFLLLPGVLTQEGIPHSLRTIGVIPPVFIFAGLGGCAAYFWLNSLTINKKALASLSVLLLLTVAGREYYKYFVMWADNSNVSDAFTRIFASEGSLLSELSRELPTVVVVNEPGVPVPNPGGIPMPAQTIIFMELGDCAKLYGINGSECRSPYSQFILPDAINEFTINKKTAIMPQKFDEALFRELENKFPGGSIKSINGITYYETN